MRTEVIERFNDLDNFTEIENKEEVTFVNVFGEVTNERLSEE